MTYLEKLLLKARALQLSAPGTWVLSNGALTKIIATQPAACTRPLVGWMRIEDLVSHLESQEVAQ